MANFKDIMAMCLDGGEAMLPSLRRWDAPTGDIAKTKTLIADLNITKESFTQLDPSFFDEHFSDHRGARRKRYDQQDFEKLARRLANNKHLTRHKLWMDYIAAPAGEGESKYQYSQFCERLRTHIRTTGMTSIIEHEPGQELYVDWAGDKVSIIDKTTGEVGMKASLFVAICPYSSLLFVTATANEKMDNWIACHVKALDYLDKRPGIIVPDNAPTATYRPVKNKPGRRIHKRYADFADYYDILLVPARPGKPRDKAAVERAVQLVYTRILGYFDAITFYSLDELNEAIAQRIDDINMNMPRPDGITRRELFDADEAPLMCDLPDTPFTEVSWRAVKVDRNWHICCDYQYYSVPFQYIGKTLRARLTNSLASIFDGDELVAEHSRMHGFKYRYCTDPAHTPDKDIAGVKPLTRDELLARASSFGPATTKVVSSILERNAKAVPRGVLVKLGNKHNKTTLEPASKSSTIAWHPTCRSSRGYKPISPATVTPTTKRQPPRSIKASRALWISPTSLMQYSCAQPATTTSRRRRPRPS